MCLGTQEFDKLYQRLGIEITERGESFYNPMLPVRGPLPFGHSRAACCCTCILATAHSP